MWEQQRALKHEAHVPFFGKHLGEVTPIQQDPPAAGVLKPRNNAQNCALARTARAKQRSAGSGEHIEIDASEGMGLMIDELFGYLAQ